MPKAIEKIASFSPQYMEEYFVIMFLLVTFFRVYLSGFQSSLCSTKRIHFFSISLQVNLP